MLKNLDDNTVFRLIIKMINLRAIYLSIKKIFTISKISNCNIMRIDIMTLSNRILSFEFLIQKLMKKLIVNYIIIPFNSQQ